MKLVVIESPLAGDFKRNKAYACLAMRDSLDRGEAPFASHLLYDKKGILDDTKPEERLLGMEAGFLWGSHAELVAVYEDLGISPGMHNGIQISKSRNISVEYRKIEDYEEKIRQLLQEDFPQLDLVP